MSNMIQVDPDKVIEKLIKENSALNHTKVLMEVAYEQLQEELEVTKRELSGLRATQRDSAPEPSTK